MEINGKDVVLKACSRCAVLTIKENVLLKPGWYIQIIKSPFFSPNMGFQTDVLEQEWIFLMKDAG